MADARASRGGSGSPAAPGGVGGRPDPKVRDAGLCNRCRFRRDIVSNRGSAFVLCELSAVDQRYVRYPTLPVWRCPGFELHVDG